MPYTSADVKGVLEQIRKYLPGGSQVAAFIDTNRTVYYCAWKRSNKEPFSAVSFLAAALHDTLRVVPSSPKIYVLHAPSDLDRGYAALLNSATVVDVSNVPDDPPVQFDDMEAYASDLKERAFGFMVNLTPPWSSRYPRHLEAFALPQVVLAPDARVDMRDTFVGRLYMMAVYAKLTGTFSLIPNGNAIGAILVGDDGQILAWGLNTADINKTCHAEVNLIQSYFMHNPDRRDAGMPTGSTLFTTLKPCKMCAGLILESAEDPATMRVVYNQHDDTALAGTTCLDTYTTGSKLRIQSLLSAMPGKPIKTLAHSPSQERHNWRTAGPNYEAIEVRSPTAPSPLLTRDTRTPDMSAELESGFRNRPKVRRVIETRIGLQEVEQQLQMTEWLQSAPLREWIRRVASDGEALRILATYTTKGGVVNPNVTNAGRIIDQFLRRPKMLK